MTDFASRACPLLVLIFSALLLATSAAAADSNRPDGLFCQNSTTTNSAFGDTADLALRDVTGPDSGEPLACVICNCGSSMVYYWGTSSCSAGDPTCTEVHDGVARTLPEVQTAPSMAVPALSLIGAIVLAGGILTGTFLNRNRSS
jgi:hypothetical protein